MSATRKYYFKLLVFTIIVFAIAKIWGFAAIWRPYMLALAGICLLFAIVPILGRPLHMVWEAYLKRTEQGPRFFQGAALALFVIAYYRMRHVFGVDVEAFLASLDFAALPAGDFRYWALAAGISLVIGIIPPLAALIFGLWMKLAHGLQYVVSRIILTVTFIVVVFPLGILAKIVGKKFLIRGPNPEEKTYWIDREQVEWSPEPYGRQF